MILRAAYNYSVDSIIKEDVRQNIIKQAIERSRLEPDDLNEMVSNITGEISRVKTETIDINAYYSASCPEEEFRDIYKYYVKTLKKMGLIDFDDMLLYCHELLTTRRDAEECEPAVDYRHREMPDYEAVRKSRAAPATR